MGRGVGKQGGWDGDDDYAGFCTTLHHPPPTRPPTHPPACPPARCSPRGALYHPGALSRIPPCNPRHRPRRPRPRAPLRAPLPRRMAAPAAAAAAAGGARRRCGVGGRGVAVGCWVVQASAACLPPRSSPPPPPYTLAHKTLRTSFSSLPSCPISLPPPPHPPTHTHTHSLLLFPPNAFTPPTPRSPLLLLACFRLRLVCEPRPPPPPPSTPGSSTNTCSSSSSSSRVVRCVWGMPTHNWWPYAS